MARPHADPFPPTAVVMQLYQFAHGFGSDELPFADTFTACKGHQAHDSLSACVHFKSSGSVQSHLPVVSSWSWMTNLHSRPNAPVLTCRHSEIIRILLHGPRICQLCTTLHWTTGSSLAPTSADICGSESNQSSVISAHHITSKGLREKRGCEKL